MPFCLTRSFLFVTMRSINVLEWLVILAGLSSTFFILNCSSIIKLYQESDLLHLGLYSSLTSANSPDFYLLTLLTFLTTSRVVAVFIAKAGHVWVN